MAQILTVDALKFEYGNAMLIAVFTDPYEQKLHKMFQSCDTAKSGLLDTTALIRLCTMLELRGKGAALINNLSTDASKSGVSFLQFKEALLNFLGTEIDECIETQYANNDTESSLPTREISDNPEEYSEMILGNMSALKICEIWERANITNGKNLLLSLGFEDDIISVQQLQKILEEEIRNLNEDPSEFSTLQRALLALQFNELSVLRIFFRQAQEENKKLRSDNKDANKRVLLQAAEIDERHAALEETSRKEIIKLEQRHSAIMHEITVRMTSDREQWGSLRTQLENRIKCMEQDVHKIKTELEQLRSQNFDLDIENHNLQKKVRHLMSEVTEKNQRIAFMESSSNPNVIHDEAINDLLNQIKQLQIENTNLRDKYDELEAVNMQIARKNLSPPSIYPKSQKSLAIMQHDGNHSSQVDILEENPQLELLSKYPYEVIDGECAKIHKDSTLPLNYELLNVDLDITIQQNTKPPVRDPTQKTDSFLDETSIVKTDCEKSTEQSDSPITSKNLKPDLDLNNDITEERCKKLELTINELREAYEECEDYWAAKLSDERQFYEKERQIYEDERTENNKKFLDLVEKVQEYEEQYKKMFSLAPIKEVANLEQQYIDLEVECEEIRKIASKLLKEKFEEISQLKQANQALQRQLKKDILLRNSKSTDELENHSSIEHRVGRYSWTGQKSSNIIKELKKYKKSEVNPTLANTSLLRNCFTEDARSTSSSNKSPEENADSDCSSSIFKTKKHQKARKKIALAFTRKSCLQLKTKSKRLRLYEASLLAQIKNLSQQRDSIVRDLQRLDKARPAIKNAFMSTSHPSLIRRVNELQKNNEILDNIVKRQQQYINSIQETWRQHQIELCDATSRSGMQSLLLEEQYQRLHNADILVKNLYVENSNLSAIVQQLQQQNNTTAKTKISF